MDKHFNVEAGQLFEEQRRLAEKARLYDAFGKVRRIAGLDCSYIGDLIIGGAVAVDFDMLMPVEKAHIVRKLDFPYIPGLLAYRESKAMIGAAQKLKVGADVLMIDGFGTNHPRRCGIATQIGLDLELPTIGVGKSFLCGEIRKDDYIYQDGERVGKMVFSKSSKKPVYVSPGHRISLDTSIELVEKCVRFGRLPEPIRFAHEYVTSLKNSC
ncbi:MAG TPA: endonuclease V [Methanocella sp.]|nr:endonuclease V [Methanocella sp.]